MKILIISDSHGNIANLKHVMGFGKKIGAKAVIHCGDWSTIESIEMVLSYELPLYSVLGNADISPEVEKILSNKCKKFDRVFLTLELDGKRIGVIHSINNLQSKIDNLDIIFYGHNHRQSESDRDGIKIVNPGALENDINFVVYDTNSVKIEFVHE
jgi:uncharacterized protein